MTFLRPGLSRARPVSLTRYRLAVALLSGVALAPGLAPGLAFAQQTGEDTSVALGTIRIDADGDQGPDSSTVASRTVTANKTAGEVIDASSAISVVTEQELRRRGVSDILGAIAYTSGVTVDEYGSDNRFDFYRIRGFSGTGTGTYLDSLPMRTMSYTGPRIEPYGLQRVEVLKGSTSTLFGLNAPGGLVNSISKRPTDYAFGEVYTTLGEDHSEIGLDFGGPLDPRNNLSYRITAKWQDAKQDTKYQDDDRRYFAPALTWKPTDATSLTVLAKFFQNNGNSGNSIPAGVDVPRDTFYGEPDFANMDRIERSVGYEFAHDFGGGLSFRQNARYSNIDSKYRQVYLDASSPTGRYAYAVDGTLQSFAIDTQLQYDRSFGTVQSRTLAGIEYNDSDVSEVAEFGYAGAIDTTRPVYCGIGCITLFPYGTTDMTLRTTGVYAQQELSFDNRWIATIGLRQDRARTDTGTDETSNTQTAFTKRLGLTYKATPDWSIYGNYSESFEPIGAYYAGQVAAAKPQRGKQYEIGTKFRPTGSDALFSAAVFDLEQTNVPRADGLGTIRQIGEVDVKGLELEARMAMAERLNLTFAYNYWDAEIVGGTQAGNQPQLTPKNSASVWTDYTFAASAANRLGGDLTVGAGARYVGSRYADDDNTARLSSTVVIDAMANYQMTEDTSVALNVSNLFDRDYVASTNFDQTSLFYGDGRTVRVSLRHTW